MVEPSQIYHIRDNIIRQLSAASPAILMASIRRWRWLLVGDFDDGIDDISVGLHYHAVSSASDIVSY